VTPKERMRLEQHGKLGSHGLWTPLLGLQQRLPAPKSAAALSGFFAGCSPAAVAAQHSQPRPSHPPSDRWQQLSRHLQAAQWLRLQRRLRLQLLLMSSQSMQILMQQPPGTKPKGSPELQQVDC